jgi:hypothetical protein
MVKIADKEHKRSPLASIYGLFLAVGLYAIAFVITSEVLMKKVPQLRDAALSIAKPPIGTIIVSFGVWFVLLAAAFFVVAILVGKDPTAGNQMPLPPKAKDLKKKKK